MIIHKVGLSNFRSHENSELNFTPGINAIVGAGGVGKTSIIDAIGYGVFGALPVGVKKGDLANVQYAEKGGFISIDFDSIFMVEKGIPDGSSLLYKRASLVADGETDVREAICEIYGMSKPDRARSLFYNLIGITQGWIDAIFMVPTHERVATFNRMLDLDEYKGCFTWLLSLQRDIESEIAAMDMKLAIAEDAAKSAQDTLAELGVLKAEAESLLPQISKKERDIDFLERDIRAIEEYRQKTLSIKGKLATLEESVRDMEFLYSWEEIEPVCPMCGQAVKDEGVTAGISAQKEKLMSTMDKISDLKDEVAKREYVIDGYDLSEKINRRSVLRIELGTLKKRHSFVTGQYSAMEASSNVPDTDGIKGQIKSLTVLKSRVGQLRDVFGKADRLIASSVANAVSESATEFIRQIYPDATVQIDSTFQVRANLLGSELGFGSLSKSQKAITALSIILPMAASISPFEIIFLDEPFANMDANQVEAVAAAIRDCNWFKQVILTTHRADIDHVFDNVIFLER